MPTLEFDRQFLTDTCCVIAGMDEAGRGPLCGPVVAAACILPLGLYIEGLDDSKKLTEKKREKLFDIIKEKTGKEPLEVFEAAMENVMPLLEVKARRIGGATYQVPIDVRPERRQTLGLRWLTTYSRARNERTMCERLAAEIMDAMNGLGGAVKKREDTHKMAEANKAFAHYRW